MNDEAKSKDALIQELQATRSRLEAAERCSRDGLPSMTSSKSVNALKGS